MVVVVLAPITIHDSLDLSCLVPVQIGYAIEAEANAKICACEGLVKIIMLGGFHLFPALCLTHVVEAIHGDGFRICNMRQATDELPGCQLYDMNASFRIRASAASYLGRVLPHIMTLEPMLFQNWNS